MNELIAVNFDTQTVSARELHERLNIGTKFATWFPRMTEYGFAEGIDYSTCYPKLGSESHGGQNMVDYNISVDMAKQICMIQRTPEGKACRQYLIDLEKAWNTPEQIFARALKLADRTIESLKNQNIALISDNERMRPKEIFAFCIDLWYSILSEALPRKEKKNEKNSEIMYHHVCSFVVNIDLSNITCITWTD